MSRERVQKILARAGYGSRRGCEKYIRSGRVTVNKKKISLGARADTRLDEIRVDGKIIKVEEEHSYIALYKPRKVLSDNVHTDNRKNVFDLIPIKTRLFAIGRLDYHSQGLMILTNDGDLTNKLTHPRYEHEKEYKVLVARKPDEEQLEKWQRGVVLEDGFKTSPAEVNLLSSHGKGAWLQVILKEGHKRQIRETAKTIGLPVVRLIRVRIGSLRLGNLKPGEWRDLTATEVNDLVND